MTARTPNRTKAVLTTSLPRALVSQLEELASQEGMPKNHLIEEALRKFFSERAKENAAPDQGAALENY